MKQSYWIWYPGDFELYHAMRQNFSRIERGYGWPAFWKSEGFRNRVVFRRTYELTGETVFCVHSHSIGYCMVTEETGEKKYPLGKEVSCGPGKVSISVHAGCVEAFPSIYIVGDVIYSDSGWMVEDYAFAPVEAGYCKYFTQAGQNPTRWDYQEKVYQPVEISEVQDGVLFTFETELTAVLQVNFKNGVYRPVTICCGESKEEALDQEHCYHSWQPDEATKKTPCCALRFAFIPDCRKDEVELSAIHQYVDIPVRASFSSSDPLINRIWSVAEHTFQLCSGIFFIDGVKRDQWIWSGDAYQSFFVNQYLMADPDINRRTLLALRGNDPMVTHINTILDYSLYWILGVKAHFDAYADVEFIRQVYPKMCSLMEFCEGQLDEHGFLLGREKDWVFIDWADFDREGPLCAEQMLYLACWRAMAEIAAVLGKASGRYEKRFKELKDKVLTFYWDKQKNAFVDSFVSGKRHVTRHGNIFAILFDLVDQERKELLLAHVLNNPRIPMITTPYFKFYEMDAFCKMGCRDEVLEQIKAYWGGMLERGAVTFWEEYDPQVSREEQYDMYGDKFGKSLCHAWSASPIYLLGKYFVGLEITDAQKGNYELHPHLEMFSWLDCTLPMGDKEIHVQWDGNTINRQEKDWAANGENKPQATGE